MTYPEFLSPYVFGPLLPIRWYGLMYIVGIICSIAILTYQEKKGLIVLKNKKIKKDKQGKEVGEGGPMDMVFYGTIGAIVGARIGYFLFYSPSSFLRPWEIMGIDLNNGFHFYGFAGMSFHGGFIGLFIALVIFSKKYHYNFYDIADNIVLPASVCLFFGRIGNFLNAELYGRITNSVFGMRFPMYDAVGGYETWKEMIPAIRPYTDLRHPSQLYEAFLEGIVLAVISFILTKSKNPNIRSGTRSWLWIMLYGLFRTLVEFVREISEWNVGFITAGMLYSIPMIIIGLSGLIYIYTRKGKSK